MKLICLNEIDSSSRYLRALADEGAEHGTLVLADRQTAGRGRLDHTFESPQGGLYMSLLIRCGDLSPQIGLHLTIASAVAAAEALEAAVPSLSVGIKWVNDLYLDGRKVAGILSEASLSPSGGVDYAIVGIGINLCDGRLPPALAEIATSVEAVSGVSPDRVALALDIAERILAWVSHPHSVIDEYRRRQILIGRRVRCLSGDRSFAARVRGVDDDGGLVVSRFGRKRILRFGEVSVRIRR